MKVTVEELEHVYELARERLLSERGAAHHWAGELSPSALSTATAVSALHLADGETHAERVARGLEWLRGSQNPDGGWGDTTRSRSNISTTCLVLAAFALTGRGDESLLDKTRRYIDRHGGIEAVVRRYGGDRTFSAPILMDLAIAGLTGWESCPRLPFWLAVFPTCLLKHLGLKVVSYALPALIAVGIVQFTKARSCNRLSRFIKRFAVGPALRRLEEITPRSGGFLEATPITSFVAMSLIASGRARHPVVTKNVAFLCREQNPDGSWKIERDLAVWLTTLSVKAIGQGDVVTRDWLLSEQTRTTHPYVASAPGAWGWTNSSGSVPDADDTSGALVALSLMPGDRDVTQAALKGVAWLLNLQNSDGGWPTFCRGWQRLPFDRSCADITAHALMAVSAWRTIVDEKTARRIDKAVERGFAYLEESQEPDGSWLPLWFGNEKAPNEGSSVYGTSRVLMAYRDLNRADGTAALRGVGFLLKAQNPDGSWGGGPNIEGSIEETALACEGLCGFTPEEVHGGLEKGLAWLCREIPAKGFSHPTPIGLYFARLWYFEKLYPIVFSVAALRRAMEWKRSRTGMVRGGQDRG